MASNLSLDQVLKKISKDYGDSVAKYGADDLTVDGVLSLGSPTADFCLYGGVPEGRIIELCGPEGGGKTTTSFLIAASYIREELKRNPDNPRSIVFLDNEGTLDPTWAYKFGYDLSEDAPVRTVVLRPEGQNAEQIFDMALDCLKTGEVGLLIFDSIATLVPAQIADESMEKYQMGGIAKSLTRFANTALGLLRKYKATLVAINQVRENIGGYGQPLITPGGRSWKHACSSRLMFKRGTFFDEDGNDLKTTAESPAGHRVDIAVLKTKTSKWDRKGGSYTINYDKGIDILTDTIEAAIQLGLISQLTSMSYGIIDLETGELKLDSDGNEIKIVGRKNIKPYFEEHKDEWKLLYDAVYEKIKQKDSPNILAFQEMLNSNIDESFGDVVDVLKDDENSMFDKE